MQRLAQKDEVHAGRRDRRRLDVSQAVFEVLEAVLSCQLGTVGHHLLAVVHGDDLSRPLREELGQGALARAQIGDDKRRQQFEQRFAQALPRTARDVVTSKLARQRVEVSLRRLRPLPQHHLEGFGVLFDLAKLRAGGVQQGEEMLVRRLVLCAGFVDPVEPVFSAAAVTDQFRRLQFGKLGGNVRLRQRKHLLQLGHAEFLLLQQQQNPHPRGIGDKAEGFEDRGHVGGIVSTHHDTSMPDFAAAGGRPFTALMPPRRRLFSAPPACAASAAPARSRLRSVSPKAGSS